MIGIPLALATTMSQVVLLAQASNALEIARLLADEKTRQVGIVRVVADESKTLPLLLSWTKVPPKHVDQRQLLVGLAEVFGHLRTKAAIPFLIRNISLQRWLDMNTWLKTEKVIEERSPAVVALVKIGPDASRAIIKEHPTLDPGDRVAAIFVVAKIGDPEARGFLSSLRGLSRAERYWAEDGLRRLEERR